MCCGSASRCGPSGDNKIVSLMCTCAFVCGLFFLLLLTHPASAVPVARDTRPGLWAARIEGTGNGESQNV